MKRKARDDSFGAAIFITRGGIVMSVRFPWKRINRRISADYINFPLLLILIIINVFPLLSILMEIIYTQNFISPAK